ncbi:MAG: hypothetical protein H0X66_12060 [Verrucomicrobia bacterium]|nr:hypothetical protein [Verrucomicrobiota bacterium]
MTNNTTYPRILGIAPTSRGFGYAVLEGGETLVDWAVKSAKGDKNADCLKEVEAMFKCYEPGVIVLEDASAEGSQRSPRIRKLIQELVSLSSKHGIKAELFSRDQVKRILLSEGEGTKHDVAEAVAKRFPEELGSRLPPKRKLWMSENYGMGIFDAVALVLAFRQRKKS